LFYRHLGRPEIPFASLRFSVEKVQKEDRKREAAQVLCRRVFLS